MRDWKFPTQFALFVRVLVKQDRFPQFKSAATRIATAFHQHGSARPWAAYSTVAGPGLYAYVLLPLENIADLDGMVPLEQVMSDVYGMEGLEDLSRFREAILDMDTSVLSGLEMDRPPVATGGRPPEYLFYVSVALHASRVSGFLPAVRKAVAAQGDESRWFAYGTFAGRNRIHGFAAGESIADLASIMRAEKQVTSVYGAEEGQSVMAAIQEGVAGADSSILRYLSHQDD